MLEVISRLLQIFAEILMAALLALLASGWQTIYTGLDLESGAEFTIPVLFGFVAIHTILLSTSFIRRTESYSHHDYAGWQGAVLFGVKLAMWLIFLCLWW